MKKYWKMILIIICYISICYYTTYHENLRKIDDFVLDIFNEEYDCLLLDENYQDITSSFKEANIKLFQKKKYVTVDRHFHQEVKHAVLKIQSEKSYLHIMYHQVSSSLADDPFDVYYKADGTFTYRDGKLIYMSNPRVSLCNETFIKYSPRYHISLYKTILPLAQGKLKDLKEFNYQTEFFIRDVKKDLYEETEIYYNTVALWD